MSAPFTTRTDLDVAILWEHDDYFLRQCAKAGRLPSHVPLVHAKCPGALVAIANRSGDVMWVFTVERVEPRRRLKVANGEVADIAYMLIARPGTFRRPRGRDPRKVVINPFALVCCPRDFRQ